MAEQFPGSRCHNLTLKRRLDYLWKNRETHTVDAEDPNQAEEFRRHLVAYGHSLSEVRHLSNSFALLIQETRNTQSPERRTPWFLKRTKTGSHQQASPWPSPWRHTETRQLALDKGGGQ